MPTDPKARTSSTTSDLIREVRRTRVLVSAWHAIRRNAETSQTPSTKQKARDFGQNLPTNLRSLQGRLVRGYEFEPAYGATLPKGPGKVGNRPVVVAPLEDRIVQRAILEVLQSARHLTGVQAVLNTETSIGGIPGKGVDHAIKLVEQRATAGDRFVAGSDIGGFFTKISRPSVIAFLSAEGVPADFLDLVERALTVELSNAATLSPEDLRLFPTGPDGVAQGCPLSALAGNIVLADFDRVMNERGITCVRYIDDFVLIGRTAGSVDKAMTSAKARLASLNMAIYDPEKSPNKAFRGTLAEGHTFLGYRLLPGVYPPSRQAVERLRERVRALVSDGKRTLRKAARGKAPLPHERCYAQTLVAIDNTVRGWLGSFQSANCPEEFAAIDAAIDRDLDDFRAYYNSLVATRPKGERRDLMRVQRLAD